MQADKEEAQNASELNDLLADLDNEINECWRRADNIELFNNTGRYYLDTLLSNLKFASYDINQLIKQLRDG